MQNRLLVAALLLSVILLYTLQLIGHAAQPGPLSLSVLPMNGKAFTFGKPTTAFFTLKNTGDKAVVVTEILATDDAGAAPVVLSSSVYGGIGKESDGSYNFGEMVQDATREALHAGFLLPGQQVTVDGEYRSLARIARFTVSYLSSSHHYDGTAASLAPLDVYIADARKDPMSRTFHRFSAKAWHSISAVAMRTEQTGPGASDRAVLLEGDPGKSMCSILTVPCVTDKTDFVLNDARATAARISGHAKETVALSYSSALQGYVVAEKQDCWLLKSAGQTGRGTLLPAMPLSLPWDIDHYPVRVQVGEKQPFGITGHEDPAGWKLWEIYPVTYGDGMYTQGEFIQVTAKQFPAFLATVRVKGDSLTEHQYFFRSRYFKLAGAK